MVEEAEILKHHPYPPPQLRQVGLGDARTVAAEIVDQPACRLERHEQEPQQRRLAGAGWPAQELEGARRNLERNVAQDLRTHPVSHADILEADHGA